MFECLFIDLDETILDFHKAEFVALGKTLLAFGIEPTEQVRGCYDRINRACWSALERGEMNREQVRIGRFAGLLEELGVCGDPQEYAECYETNLSQGHYFLPGAYEALEALSEKYRLFLASNGLARVQAGRLKSAGIGRFFERIFISQEIGADKPSKEFFDRCFQQIPGLCRERCMIVGDSLSSDILGGQNAGIATCWVNPKSLPGKAGIRVDHEIESLAQLYPLLEQLREEMK